MPTRAPRGAVAARQTCPAAGQNFARQHAASQRPCRRPHATIALSGGNVQRSSLASTWPDSRRQLQVLVTAAGPQQPVGGSAGSADQSTQPGWQLGQRRQPYSQGPTLPQRRSTAQTGRRLPPCKQQAGPDQQKVAGREAWKQEQEEQQRQAERLHASPPPQLQRRQQVGQPPAQQQQQRRAQSAQSAHQQQPQPQPRQPPYLVVVEGVNDMRAVRRAVPGAPVYVLGTATVAGSQHVVQELKAAAARCRGVIVLTDPDVAGRQARRQLDDALPGCLHAFLPSPLATAGAATKHHEAGNVGVEHAAPEVVRAALAAPRRSDPQRLAFSREQLLAWGLVAELGERGGSVTARRRLVCAHLGLGECDGKQLGRQLNRYCFSREEVEAALAWAERQLQREQQAGQQQQPARNAHSNLDTRQPKTD